MKLCDKVLAKTATHAINTEDLVTDSPNFLVKLNKFVKQKYTLGDSIRKT